MSYVEVTEETGHAFILSLAHAHCLGFMFVKDRVSDGIV